MAPGIAWKRSPVLHAATWLAAHTSHCRARLSVGRTFAFASLVALVAPGLGGYAHGDTPPLLEVGLRPVPGPGGGEIAAVEVTITIDRAGATSRRPPLRMPHVVSNVDTVALAIEVVATDANGPLPLTATDEGVDAAATRTWQPTRPAAGTVTLRYRAPITNRLGTRGAAPPFELRSEAGAFSGAGLVFLLLPESQEPHRLALRWDLSALPRDAAAISSLGAGDVPAVSIAPLARLHPACYMAGGGGTFPQRPVERGFFGAWHGNPPFDARELLQWTEKLHANYATFFGNLTQPRYGVFLRRNRVNPGGGVELMQSFVATYDHGTDPADLRLLMAHEMFHTWAPSIARPGGLMSSWFGEGLAVFYQRALPRRFGMIGSQAFLDDLNFHAGRLYTNALAGVPNAEVPLRFWEDTRIRTIPYDRGSFYFVRVDHAMREASGGRRSLDDLMLAMLTKQRSGQPLANADWEALLARELGATAVAEFHATLAGAIPVPASDAFGPCFRRTVKRLRRYELGFDPKVLVEPRRIVRGLVAGSAAERAGLRNGDEILDPVGQDRLQGEQAREIALRVRRDGREFPLRYLPRGEAVDAWQWERDPAATNSDCRS